MIIDLPEDLLAAIRRYNNGDFAPASIGALNLVAFIGERTACIVKAADGTPVKRSTTTTVKSCQHCGVALIKGPTSLDIERFERGVCGGCQ